MLQQEPQTEQTPSPAQRRVTPEELAKALAAVEARKEQSARETEGTIPIGEAVQQLGFDATPEEIWAEVQARRTNAARNRSSTRRRVLLPAAFSLFLLISADWIHGAAPKYGAVSPSIHCRGRIQACNVINQNITVTENTASGLVVKLLSEVPDGCPVTCLYDGISQISPGYLARSGGYPSASATTINDAQWTIIKHNGKVYLCGWTNTRVSDEALGMTSLTVFSNKIAAGRKPIPVMLQLKNFKSAISYGYYIDPIHWEAITVTGVHPDKYLWGHGEAGSHRHRGRGGGDHRGAAGGGAGGGRHAAGKE